jgi:pimeloyl-ACP methyl ester carboxylesterase
MNWPTGTCRTSGVDIHYTRAGGSGSPVVLLHGLVASGACWTPLARALEDEYDVVMPDARGHGCSGAPLSAYTYDDHAADVIALIGELELRAPMLLGHSMGGMTAAVVANRAPALVRGLVLVDPTFLTPERQREVHGSDVAEQHRRLLGQSKGEVLAQLRSRHPHRSPELLEFIAAARLRTRLEAFAVLVPPMPDYRALMRDIDVPVLLVIGDRGVVSLETARELEGINPRVRIEVLRDAGHGIPYDRPGPLQMMVKSFLRSC